MIGIIGAMAIEVENLVSLMTQTEKKKIGSVEYVKGMLDGKEAVIAVCGIGKVAAAICAQTMIMEYAPVCIVNTGVAGSLSAELGICDMVVAESLVQHDMDTTPLGDPPGLISGLGIVNIPTDSNVAAALVKAANEAGGKAKRGIIASGDRFVVDPADKKFIVDTFGASACEMEGAAIAQACFSAGVPFCVVRSISDSADGSAHMDYSEFLPVAAATSAATMRNFVSIYG